MADREEYMLSKPAEWIDEVIKGAVVGTKAMPELSEQFKAQFRDNIGATSSDASWQPKGYCDTFEELQATITAPKPGDAYGVGLEPPYDIWVWDGLRGRWLNHGPIKGMDGKHGVDGEDGSDANVTKENIITALGYTPADAANVGVPDGSIGTAQLADGAVTAEKLDPNIDLGGWKLVWENESPTSDFDAQNLTLDFSNAKRVLLQYQAQTSGSWQDGVPGGRGYFFAELPIGESSAIQHGFLNGTPSTVIAMTRRVKITTDEIAIGVCKGATIASSGGVTFSNYANQCVPTRIYIST